MTAKKMSATVMAVAVMMTTFMAEGIMMKTEAATTWRSRLYPANWTPGYTNGEGQFLHDFSYAGYERGEKEIPQEMEGLVADVTEYGADNTGKTDATAAIQSAIDAVEEAGGGCVYLPAGTYTVRPAAEENAAALKIEGSNLIFKGDGVGKTFIRCDAENMRYCRIIDVAPGGATWDEADDGNYYALSRDIPNTPTSTIHLTSVGDLKEGDWVIIRSDRTKEWIDEHDMEGFWSEEVNPTTMGTTFYRQITAVDAANNTIEIDIPTRYYMKMRDNARVYKVMPKQSNVGLCDFSIGNKTNSIEKGWGEEDYKKSGNGSYYVNNAFLIRFGLNINCFAQNIASYDAGNENGFHMGSNGLDLDKTRSITIMNCDFSHPQYEGGGGNGYGINICGQESLIKDCSSTSARHSFAFKYSYANGNVIYHYTSTDPKYGSDFHMYLSMSNLIDNQELNGDFIESNVRPYGGNQGNIHGHTSSQSVFWNTRGNRYMSGKNYIIDSRQYGYGYIIGTRGEASNVRTTTTMMSSKYGNVDTAPEDYKEGIGEGETLIPQSLYYDQLEKRLGDASADDFKVVAYYPNWYGDFTSKVQWDKLTHVNYAFALPNQNGTVDSVKGSEKVITGLIEAAHENDVKVCVALGGWSYSDGSLCATVFEAATDTEEKCKSLADSILEIVDEYGFDGVDVDWEYPTAESVEGYTAFMRYLKEGLTERGKLLTAAVQAVGGTYQPDEVLEMLDWINVMAYDGNSGAGHSPYSYLVDSFAYWNGTRGVPADKVVLGVPFYERPNWASYADIVKADPDNAYQDEAQINGKTVYYNGLRTMAEKARYAAENAGGIMIWEISQDAEKDNLSLLSCIHDTVEAVFAPPRRDTWMTVDLGERKTFDRAVLSWGEAYGETYLLQTSLDGEHWSTAQVVSGQNGGEDTVVFRPVEARYVRVCCLKKVSDTEDILLNVRVF